MKFAYDVALRLFMGLLAVGDTLEVGVPGESSQLGMLDQANLRVLTLEGELDLHSARGMGAALSEAVGDTTHEPVVDLTGVTFMDSSALAVLAKAAEKLRRQGRVLSLLRPSGQVARLLDITGLRDRFDVIGERPARRFAR